MINLGYKIQLNSCDFLVSLAHDVWKVLGECLSVSQNLLLMLDYYPPASNRENWHKILFLKSQHISPWVSSWLSFFTSESSSHFLLFPISGCLGSPSNHTCSASWWLLLKIVLKKVKRLRWTELTNAQTTAIMFKIINKLLRPNELVVLRWLTRSPTHS